MNKIVEASSSNTKQSQSQSTLSSTLNQKRLDFFQMLQGKSAANNSNSSSSSSSKSIATNSRTNNKINELQSSNIV